MRAAVFDFYSDLGHFKVPYTTTSPLTLPVPPKTAIYGIIGAIIGLDKKTYLNSFKEGVCQVAIKLNRPLRKTYISENLLNVKHIKMFSRMESHKHPPRTQIKFEMLKNPSFKIFVCHKDNSILDSLIEKLKFHQTVYSVAMGLSECLANFNFIGSYDIAEVKADGFISIDSLIPIDLIDDFKCLKIVPDLRVLKARLPLEMKSDRELVKSGDFLFETECKKINVKVNKFYQIEDNNVLFF